MTINLNTSRRLRFDSKVSATGHNGAYLKGTRDLYFAATTVFGGAPLEQCVGCRAAGDTKEFVGCWLNPDQLQLFSEVPSEGGCE